MTERASFEAWARSESPSTSLLRDRDGNYVEESVRQQWKTWQKEDNDMDKEVCGSSLDKELAQAEESISIIRANLNAIGSIDDIAHRLRGRYPVGPIMENGEPEFGWREFYDGSYYAVALPLPIMLQAADEIERLRKIIEQQQAKVMPEGQPARG